jgi:hypothetical protein
VDRHRRSLSAQIAEHMWRIAPSTATKCVSHVTSARNPLALAPAVLLYAPAADAHAALCTFFSYRYPGQARSSSCPASLFSVVCLHVRWGAFSPRAQLTWLARFASLS